MPSGGNYTTIQACADAAQPGDTCDIYAGTYNGWSSVRSGSAGAGYVTFQHHGTDVVHLSATYPTGQIVIKHSYIKLDGLTMTMSDSYEGGAQIRVGVSGQVNHITIVNCHFSANGINTFLVGLAADDVLFDSNLVEGPQYYIGLVQSGQRQTVSNNVFRNVTNVERVFNVAASNSLWTHNEFYNITYNAGGPGGSNVHPDIWQTINDGSTAQHNIIEDNYVHDGFGGPQIGNIETDLAGSLVNDWTIRNNIFANYNTFFVWGGNFKFYNNTFYRIGLSDGRPAVLLYQGGTGNGNGQEGGNASGAQFYNNIFVQDSNYGGGYGVSMGTVTYTYDYNYFATTSTYGTHSGSPGTHGINGGNPQFILPSSGCLTNACDFHIGATSVVIDKGTTETGFSVDKDGKPRAVPWDIGAYEHNSAVGSAPSAPTGLTAAIH